MNFSLNSKRDVCYEPHGSVRAIYHAAHRAMFGVLNKTFYESTSAQMNWHPKIVAIMHPNDPVVKRGLVDF